jgi:hypothetical protein
MKHHSDNIREIARGAGKYAEEQYQFWYQEGREGRQYNGRTWIGYYGWLDGYAKSGDTTTPCL